MTTQMDTQEINKKNFLNIFEITHLFNVSAITARRHIHTVFRDIELLKDKIKLDTQPRRSDEVGAPNESSEADKNLLTELDTLLSKVRKRIIGQTRTGEDIYILELSKEEALAKWGLRPEGQKPVQEAQDLSTQNQPEADQLITQKDSQEAEQEEIKNKPEKQNFQEGIVLDSFSDKYIKLLESQLTEKDDTIKDLRETNKFLSITNGKLNEQLKLLLEKPQRSYPQQENAG